MCGRGLSLSGKWIYCPKCGGFIDQDSYASAVEQAKSNGAILYLDSEAVEDAIKMLKVHPAAEWHEDYGAVLWWHFPVCEPPEVGHGLSAGECNADGKPTDCAKGIESGWLSHWSRIPVVYGGDGRPLLEVTKFRPA